MKDASYKIEIPTINEDKTILKPRFKFVVNELSNNACI